MKHGNSIRGLADQLAPPQDPITDLAFTTGTVVTSSPAAVTIATRSGTVQAQYHGAQPAAGDVVNVLLVAGAPIILGVPRGLPPTS